MVQVVLWEPSGDAVVTHFTSARKISTRTVRAMAGQGDKNNTANTAMISGSLYIGFTSTLWQSNRHTSAAEPVFSELKEDVWPSVNERL